MSNGAESVNHRTAAEIHIIKAIVASLHVNPRNGTFVLARIKTTAVSKTLSTSDFESAWLSLIDQGILAQMDDGVAAITNTGARRLREEAER